MKMFKTVYAATNVEFGNVFLFIPVLHVFLSF